MEKIHNIINIRGWYAAKGIRDKSFLYPDGKVRHFSENLRCSAGKRDLFDPTAKCPQEKRCFNYLFGYLVRANNVWDNDVLYVPKNQGVVGSTPIMPLPSEVGIPSYGTGKWYKFRVLDGEIQNTWATVIWC